MIKSLITPPAGSSTGPWVDCFGTKRVATQFREDFSGKKLVSLNKTFITLNLIGSRHGFDQAASY